ncbi:MAG: hypothetical protein IT166_25265 [Bryobacterales bacterium]|nr:hypothetical protein [Bryobacterales bacterium]
MLRQVSKAARTAQLRLLETYWRHSFSDIARLPLTDDLPLEALRGSTIHWPTQLQWPPAERFVHHLKVGLGQFLTVEDRPIPQLYKGVVMVEFVHQGSPHRMAVDYSDYQDRIDANAYRDSILYLKMQYRKAGYDWPGIVPGGYPLPDKSAYSYLTPIRRMADSGVRRMDVYGRYSLSFGTEVRQKALTLLTGQTSFQFCGGGELGRYSRHLMDIARSRICVDLPGNGPFCFRLIDYLAVGACVVAVEHAAQFPIPLTNGVHIAYVKRDCSDLIDTCRYLLAREQDRLSMQEKSREFFDRYLERRQLAGYYLRNFLEAVQSRAVHQ